MRKKKKSRSTQIAVVLVLLAMTPLLLLVPAPVIADLAGWKVPLFLFSLLVLLFGAGSCIRRYLDAGILGLFLVLGILGVLLLSSVSFLAFSGSVGFLPALLFLCFTVGLLSLYMSLETELQGAGLLSLLLFLSIFSSAEIFLRSLPSGVLRKEVTEIPLLVPEVDRGIAQIRRNGFRGQTPCKDCDQKAIRIFSLGGSSTFGVPMLSGSQAYPAQLQRILNERRLDEHYEVFNAGVPGYGIVQILETLREEIVQHNPDIVTVSAWFNDSSRGVGWYGYPGKTDFEAYAIVKKLRKIQNFPLYKKLSKMHLYGVFRHYMLGLQPFFLQKVEKQKIKSGKRVPVAEFRKGLEELISLSEEQKFLPIFIYEPLNRGKSSQDALQSNGYYQALRDVATQYGIPLVNTLDEIHRRRDQWLFYDFIHPNGAGHQIVAESIYQTLFGKNPTEKLALFRTNNEILTEKPFLQRRVQKDFSTGDLKNGVLRVKARLPNSGDQSGKLSILIDGSEQFAAHLSGKDFEDFEFPLHAHLSHRPVSTIGLAATVSTLGDSQFTIGKSRVYSPAHLQVKSGGKFSGWQTRIFVDGDRVDLDGRGFNLVALDMQNGKILRRDTFDTYAKPSEVLRMKAVVEEVSYQSFQPIVILSVKTAAFPSKYRKELREVLQMIGATGKLSDTFDSYAVIGVAGIEPGTALEERGARLLTLEVGDRSKIGRNLIELADLSVLKSRKLAIPEIVNPSKKEVLKSRRSS